MKLAQNNKRNKKGDLKGEKRRMRVRGGGGGREREGGEKKKR